MRRLFIKNISQTVKISGDDHEHLSRVLRARIGDEVVLCAQDGYDYVSVITAIDKNATTLKVVDKVENCYEPNINVKFYVALPKGDKLEFAVQKLTELGVSEITPFMSANVSARAESVRYDRLNKIAVEASKQCNRGIIPKVNNLISFEELLREIKSVDCILFPYERATNVDIKEYLRSVKSFDNVAVVVGSEGGFTQNEAEMISACGGTPVTLGKRILRAETAYVAVMSVLMYEAGELK